MTLKEVRELLKSGRTIQIRSGAGWADLQENNSIAFSLHDDQYRLKPEPKYRPWRDASEVPPLALLRCQEWALDVWSVILETRYNGIVFTEGGVGRTITFEIAFKDYCISQNGGKTWTPAGVLESNE